MVTMTRARWSKPWWSFGVRLKMPWAPATFLVLSSASRRARRNSTVPGLAFLRATGTAFCSSTPASQAWPPKELTLPLPWAASYLVTYSMADFLTGWSAGNWAATSTGPVGRTVSSQSLPQTRRKSLLATPCVW
ncbi:hypothetical protein SDC9_171201 [bioreactor metagenome]|uniref:Uncharacterized protein n=1 Tax=bioreactor metagenome TaxID=1076179 RepID=A0A645GA80_9ZZZZ